MVLLDHPVEPIQILMEPIETQLVLNLDDDEGAAVNAGGKSRCFYRRMTFVMDKVPKALFR